MRLLSLSLLLLGCAPVYPDVNQGTYTHYKFHATYITPDGWEVDDPLRQLDVARLDWEVRSVTSCLSGALPLPSSEVDGDWCSGLPIHPRPDLGLRILVPPDWRVSTCSGGAREVFPCSVPSASCEVKGQEPTAACPCSCRAMVQDDDIIVTAPNLELFPAQLVQLLTGCTQIWNGGRLNSCGLPLGDAP